MTHAHALGLMAHYTHAHANMLRTLMCANKQMYVTSIVDCFTYINISVFMSVCIYNNNYLYNTNINDVIN